jgi:hypothetical protein
MYLALAFTRALIYGLKDLRVSAAASIDGQMAEAIAKGISVEGFNHCKCLRG